MKLHRLLPEDEWAKRCTAGWSGTQSTGIFKRRKSRDCLILWLGFVPVGAFSHFFWVMSLLCPQLNPISPHPQHNLYMYDTFCNWPRCLGSTNHCRSICSIHMFLYQWLVTQGQQSGIWVPIIQLITTNNILTGTWKTHLVNVMRDNMFMPLCLCINGIARILQWKQVRKQLKPAFNVKSMSLTR